MTNPKILLLSLLLLAQPALAEDGDIVHVLLDPRRRDEILAAFARASGRTIPQVVVGRRPGDVAACYADPAKAFAELGWRPTRGLDEMCASLWAWQSRNPDGFGD